MRKKCIGLLLFCYFICSSNAVFGKSVKQSKIIFCGVAKNVAGAVPATVRSIQTIGEQFADYRVFIYENNSTDDTARKYSEWAKRNPRVAFFSENLAESDFYVEFKGGRRKLFRTEILARARNIVLSKAMDPEFDDYDYVMMVDLDFAQPWDIEGIMSSFNYRQKWDAITANGKVKHGYYYDWYAFRDWKYPFGPELYGPNYWQKIRQWGVIEKKVVTDPFQQVLSAFGGLGIYKRSSIVGCFYSGLITKDMEDVMQDIFDKEDRRSMAHIENYHFQRPIVPGTTLPGGKIFWFMDVGLGYTDCPTVCEHVPFHSTMIKKGHDKIFINPRMIMKYWECL